MVFLSVIFDVFYGLTNQIEIPIPLSTQFVVFLSLFDIIIFSIFLGIVIFIFKELFDFNVSVQNQVVHQYVGRTVNKAFNEHDSKLASEQKQEFLKSKKKGKGK